MKSQLIKIKIKTMENLQINKSAALIAHENTDTKGKKLLEDLFGKNLFIEDATEIIKNFNDVLKELGENDSKFIEYNNLEEAMLHLRNMAKEVGVIPITTTI